MGAMAGMMLGQGALVTYLPLAGSLAFNGAGQYLTMSPGVTFGGSAFTIEGWFYNTGNLTNRPLLATDQSNGMSAFITDSATISLDRYGGGYAPSYTFPIGTFKTNQWQYIIINRNASTLETVWVGTFVNTSSYVTCARATGAAGGTSISGGTQNESQAWGNSNWVGRYYGGYWSGNMTNLRLTINQARYDSNSATVTAPAKPLTTNAQTRYLMLGAVVTTDSSSTQTVTNNNFVSQTATVPF